MQVKKIHKKWPMHKKSLLEEKSWWFIKHQLNKPVVVTYEKQDNLDGTTFHSGLKSNAAPYVWILLLMNVQQTR